MIEREPQNLIFPQEMADLLLSLDRIDEAVEILYRLSEIFRLREMLRRSQETLKKILSLQPTHSEARRRLAEIYIEKGMESEGQAELLELARQIQQAQIPVDSIGEELVPLGQWILDLNAENCEILIGLTNLFQAQREKEPDWATDLWTDIQLALARHYLARGEVEQAKSSIEQVEAATADHPDLLDLRNRLDHLNRFQIPQETFRENIRQVEQHWEHGEFGAAANLLEQLVKSQPRDIELIERLATAYHEQGHRTKAVDLLEKRGQIFLSERDFPKARQCFHRILRMIPGSIPAHTALAELALAEGNSKTAIDQYIHLVDMVEDPEDWPQLVVALEKARNIDPQNEEVLRRLASSYRKVGALDQARETYRSLAELEKEHHRLESAATALQEALAIDLESRPEMTEETLRLSKIQSSELHRELAETSLPRITCRWLLNTG